MKKLRTRLGTVAAAATALALALTGCSATADAGDGESGESVSVKFGYIADFSGASLIAIANDQGLWKKHGVDVETPVFTNGPLQIQALDTGDLDFGYIGPGAMWLPASGKAKVVSLNGLGNADRVIAQKGIDSIEDLKGKKVAVPEGTSGDMILTMALKSAGMTMDDVEKVAMDPPTAVSAFSSGQVDAAGLWFPLIDTVKEQVPDLNVLAANEDFSETAAFPNVFVGAPTFVEENPEATEKVLAVIREAMDFRAENLDETVALTADMLKLDEEKVRVDAENVKLMTASELDELTADGTVNTWLTALNEYFADTGKLDDATDPSTYYTGDLFTNAGE